MLGQKLILYLADRSGATVVEYALLVASMALALIATVGLLGDDVSNLYDTIRITAAP